MARHRRHRDALPKQLVVLLLLALPMLHVIADGRAVADVATAPQSSVTVVGEPGDLVSGGGSKLFRADADQISVQKYGNNAANVYVTNSSTSILLSFNTEITQTFGPGAYSSDQGSPSTGTPHVNVTGLGGCTPTHSAFTVLDLAADFSRLLIEYELGCSGTDTAFGEVSYNEPVDADLGVAPSRIAWPTRTLGAADTPVPVTLFNTGTAPITLSNASVQDGDGQYKSAGIGQCATIAAGQSCAVTVDYVPTEAGNSSATLVVTDSSARGSHSVALSGTGFDPNAPPTPTPTPTPTSTTPARPCTNPAPNPFAPTPTPPPPPTPGIASVATLFGDANDGLTGGQACFWRGGPDRVTLGPPNSGEVQLTLGVGTVGRTDDWTFQFFAPAGQATLLPGSYFVDSGTTPGVSPPQIQPGISVLESGSACRATTGDKFTVLDAAPDYSHLWIVFQMHCRTTGSTGTFGEIRYNEPADADLLVAPQRVTWTSQTVAATAPHAPVTLVNTGTSPLTVNAVSVDGAAAADFPAGSVGTCASIAVGATCTLDVDFKPSAPGDREATLRITDSSAAGSHTVPLSGLVTTTASVVTLAGDAGDPVSGGGDQLWRSGLDRITATGSTTAVEVDAARIASVSPDLKLTFAAPLGQPLSPGMSYPSAREPGPAPDQAPAITASTRATACKTETGQFTVIDIATDLSRLWILYEAHCAGATAAAFGEIRYNEPADADVLVAPSRVAWPLYTVGKAARSVPVTVIDTGSSPLIVSPAAPGGSNASDYSQSGQCANIAAGASCALQIGFTPGAWGNRAATVKISDSSAEGFHYVILSGSGAFDGPPATFTFASRNTPSMPAQSSSLLYRNGPDRITLSGSDGGVNISANHGVGGDSVPLQMSFATGDGSGFTTGRTYSGGSGTTTSGADPAPAGTPYLSVTENHEQCYQTFGLFTVLDSAPDLSRLWLVYDLSCPGSSYQALGEIRYNEPTDPDVTVAPVHVVVPNAGGQAVTVPVTVIDTGSAPLNVSGAAISGPAANDFSADPGGCTDPVPVGGACTVSVNINSSHGYGATEQATLTVADSSTEGAHHVELGSAVVPPSTVTLVGTHNDPVMGTGDTLFLAGRDQIQAQISSTGVQLQLNAAGAGPTSYRMYFFPPPGSNLTDAQYLGATTNNPPATRTGPGIYVNNNPAREVGSTSICTAETGHFTVLDIAPDLGRLWLVYESHCGGGAGATFGEVRINEPVDPHVVVAPAHIEFPDSARTVPVTLLNTDTATGSIKSATIGGAAATDFSVSPISACASIPVNGECQLQAAFKPTQNGDRQATLTLVDANGTSHAVALDGTGSGITPAPPAPPSPPPKITAAPPVTQMHVAAKADSTKFKHGHSTNIHATVTPAAGGRSVQLQQLSGSRWTTVQKANTGHDGKAAFTVKPKKKGSYTYRTYCPGDSTHTSATSGKVTLKAT